MRTPILVRLAAAFVLLVTPLAAADVWSGAPFSADPVALRQAADAVKALKHQPVTVLLSDLHFTFDEAGRSVESNHMIYRIEDQEGIQNWADISAQWEAWHQSKPEIRARAITAEGTVHWIDPKTLNDVPVHEDAPDLYTDERRYGGPLPAIAIGTIVEQEIILRDNAPLFAAGGVYRWGLGWSVPVNKTHFVISHADALPLHYEIHLLPEASVVKLHENDREIITLDQGPLTAYQEQPDHVPFDIALRPEIEFSTGTSWREVVSEYARLSDEKVRVADVQSLLAKLNLKEGSRSEIIRRIVATLHKNIRYTGVEFGESSLIPQYPSETLKRKYGDCKDKATLLVAMLRAAGIPAHLALLSAGPGRDINPELAGIGMFDHAIVYVPPDASNPGLWIDATAQYSQLGTLPWMDYGRSALIIAEGTDTLKKTPELTADGNVSRELRVFTLPEYGKANIAEIDDEVGPGEADYREYYSGDSKEVRKNGDEYVKEMYLADSLTSIEHDDLSDLDKPASIKFVTKGKRGSTDLNNAVVAIRTEALFERLPRYFKTPEEHQKASAEQVSQGEDEKAQPRTVDWRLTPFATEWRYEINAPIGFKLRALPQDRHDKVDILTFNQEYSANPEGTVVKAVLRVECMTSRMTVEQAKSLRDAVVNARKADPILITFDSVGQSLISDGKIKEGLAAYRELTLQHPKEALHKVQQARALLAAGLGEQARVEAQAATALEPTSALAFSTLGLVLKHDQIGRLLKKGMDLEGSAAAYRKAISLDPDDKESRAELGMLLEYDADGTRYSENAHLKDAVAVMRELKKLDDEYARTYDDNILYDLWYAHDYQGVLDYAATLPTSDVRKGLVIAATALIGGPEAALKKSLEITADDQTRSQALMNAGAVLLRVRKYPEAAAVFTEAARGQSNASQVARSAAMFANTRVYSDVRIDPNDPRSVVQQLFGAMLSGHISLQEFKSLIYIDPLIQDDDLDERHFEEMRASFRSQMAGAALPLPVIADLVVSNTKYTVDGDDALGYKIVVEATGAAAQDVFVIREGGRYKIAAFSASQDSDPQELAFLALRELQKNDLAGAKKWLDRARDKIHMGGGDDPLSGALFPSFWTKGQEADASAIRLAALVLLPSKQLKSSNLATVIGARDAAKSEIDRARLNLVLANAYSAQERWADLLPITEDLIKAYPTSLRAFDLATRAYAGLKRFDEWDKLVQARRAEHSDELAYIRSAARVASYRGQYAEVRETIKTIIDKGQASSEDLNLYAWYALELPTPIDQESIDTGIRASDLTKNSFAIQHTLGCVYAQAGKTKQARELLLKAMDDGHFEQPNSEIWFGFGLVAEQYGVIEAARKMFTRVEKPQTEYPASSYALAQEHLAKLNR